MSDSVRPHRRQPIRLPRPWDSPGKSTGVGCHFLLQCMKVKSESEVAQSCPTLSNPMDCSLIRLFHPWDFPGKSTGMGCHCLLQVAQLCLILGPPGSSVHGVLQARILKWVAMPSSRDLANPGIEPSSPTLPADSLPSEPPGKLP